MNKLELSITSVVSELMKVENFLDNLIDRFEISDDLRGKVFISIIESVNNSILHGNKCNPNKKIYITAVKNKQELVITIEDEGKGFDFSSVSDPTTLENIDKMTGRGLFLMKKLSDEIQFEKNGAKIIITFFLNL